MLRFVIIKDKNPLGWEWKSEEISKDEEQIAKENFIHKGGGNDPETAKEE